MANGNGHIEEEGVAVVGEESQEQLESAYKKLGDLTRGGSPLRFTRQELGLLHRMMTAPEEFREEQVFLLCDFLDENEALDHVAAFYEAKELGMDTGFNVAFMFALAASNRKMGRTNRIAAILDAMSHQKFTSNVSGKGKGAQYVNPRSPLSS